MCWGGQSLFVILWRTDSVERWRQNADQSVACLSRNKAMRTEQREGHSWRWVTSRANERESLRLRRMRVSDEGKTQSEEDKI